MENCLQFTLIFLNADSVYESKFLEHTQQMFVDCWKFDKW